MDDLKPYTVEELQRVDTFKVLYKTTDGYWYRANTTTCWFANGLLRQLERAHAEGRSSRVTEAIDLHANCVQILESFIVKVIHPYGQ